MKNDSRPTRAIRLRHMILRRIRYLFDEGEAFRAVALADRLNSITRIAYPGNPAQTPGDLLNGYLADRAFENRF